MSMKFLGRHFDIHGGGVDLVFPHHENELVQSESFSGETFATYWLHNGLITNRGRKISKSDPDTIVLMSDLLAAHSPDTLRALLLSSHYRRPIDFGPGRVDEIERGLQTFDRAFERFAELTGESFYTLEAPTRRGDFQPGGLALLTELGEHRERFLDAMDDDFNTGGALGELFEIAHALNRFAHEPGLEPGRARPDRLAEYRAGMIVLRELSRILGLFLRPPGERVQAEGALTGDLLGLLVDLRNRLRKEKNFALADEIRNRLTELGVTLEDRADGSKWRIEPRRGGARPAGQ
jgi:cysteinyl-tRNA synthetase